MKKLQILVLEDMPTDAELMKRELIKGGIDADLHIVASEQGFKKCLINTPPDIILSDYIVPGFDGMEALALRNSYAPHIPFIFVTGLLGEEKAVATLKAGATDYVLKDRIARLPTEVTRAISQCQQKQEHERVAIALEAERQLVRAIFDTTKAAIVVIDDLGQILHFNPTAAKIVDLTATQIYKQGFWQVFLHPEESANCQLQVQQALLDDKLSDCVWRSTTASERIILWSVSQFSPMDNEQRMVCVGIDITERAQAEEQVYFLDNFDPVTNLPNRKLLQQQIVQYCQNLQGQSQTLLVAMMIGLGRIQEIRDIYGEHAVNSILLVVVQRLRVWQKCELLARVNDNTFALVFELKDDSELVRVIPRILQELNEPFRLNDKHLLLPTHGGIALYHRDAKEPVALLQAAEAALHRGEHQQKDDKGYTFYNAELSDDARQRIQLESELHDALKHDHELVLYYQPQIDLKTQQIVGFEALIRWQHPRLGLLLPDSFIRIAEESHLMPELGKWVLNETCRQLKKWRQLGLTLLPVAINISASQFSSPYLLNDIEVALSEFDISPSLLEIELTESASMLDPQATIMIMSQLREMGVGLAIDDFGTGYSNLSYLKRFPVHRLKLDQSFVRDIITDSDDLAISHAVIAIAHQLNLQVVAEGIETLAQLNLLANAKCDFGQGYLFSFPMAGEYCGALIGKKFDFGYQKWR